MDIESFRSNFLDSCNFVRLHGWCDQTNERIAGLLSQIRQNPNLAPELTELVHTTLRLVDSLEERLMIFVLLMELGMGPDHIAELMFQSLQGKLTNKDSLFIVRHFFRNASPVPDEITYDITKRNFISYQRAIYQALKVSGFESEFDGAHILLYLIQLLCRNNLNEQNRAMLYLLLSRIDIELPPSIEHTVSAAMLNLRDVIQEVEQRLESVLSDTLHDNNVNLEDLDWDEAQAPKPVEAARPDKDHGLNPPGLGASGLAPPEPVKPAAAPPKPAEPTPPPTKTYAGSYFDALPNPTPAGPPPKPAAAANNPKPASIPLPAGLEESAPTATGSGQPLAGAPEVAKSNSNIDYFAAQGPAATRAAGPAPSQVPESSGGVADAGPSLFQINFTRETNELKAVLQALKESESSAEKAKAVAAVFADGSDGPVAKISRAAITVFRSKIALVVLGILLAAALAWLALRFIPIGTTPSATSQPSPSPPAATDSAGPAPATAAAPVTKAPDGSVATAQPVASLAGIAGAAPVLKLESKGLLWYPRKGESLWVLYSSFRSNPQTPAELKDLARGEWQVFLQKIVAANPGLNYPDIIFAEKPLIILPAK